jgi:hypothetical protein
MATSTNTNHPPAPKMMLVSIRASHNWLDGKMRVVGYRPIQNEDEFAKSGLLLSQAINAVVQHFQLYPPKNIAILDDSLNQLQNHHPQTRSTTRSSTTATTATATATVNHSHNSSSSSTQKETNPSPHYLQEIRIQDEDLKELKILKDNMVRDPSYIYTKHYSVCKHVFSYDIMS